MVCAAFGHTSEIAEMEWDDVRWIEHGQVVKESWYEMKTSKSKAFAVAAGKTREDCVYLKSGDWLTTNQETAPSYDSSSQDAYSVPGPGEFSRIGKTKKNWQIEQNKKKGGKEFFKKKKKKVTGLRPFFILLQINTRSCLAGMEKVTYTVSSQPCYSLAPVPSC
jgi:hypothetical protein